ncbi:MAG: response regulator [Candidatus Izemoplasmataceae bacterium]
MIQDLGNGLYFISKKETHDKIHCNSYLIIEEDEAVLVEPGSMLDFDVILEEVKSLIDLNKITYVLLTHPDADLTSSMPMFERELGPYHIITEWRTKEILAFYGVHAPYYHIREHNFILKLSTERTLYFYMTPFAHYAGAFVTYDSKSKALLSGDLFGGYSKEWSLYANDDYIESMAMYHENYMPSSDFIRPVMKELSTLNIEMICPQHGSIIQKDLVKKSIDFLYRLDFYNSSNTVERIVNTNRKYDYYNILTQMLVRLLNLYTEEEINSVFNHSSFNVTFSPPNVTSALTGYKLWNQFFDLIHKKKGDSWLNSLETLVNKITSIYHIKKPEAYINRYKQIEEKQKQANFESYLLQAKLDTLEHTYKQTIEEQNKCPITNLLNSTILKELLKEEDLSNSGLLFIELDQIEEINRKYDKTVGDNTIKTLAYLVENDKNNTELLFRANSPGIILYIKQKSKEDLLSRASDIRNLINDSTSFIEHVTVGIGGVYFDDQLKTSKTTIKTAFEQGYLRVELAHQLGTGEIIFEQTSTKDLFDFTALLVDEDEVNINMITKYFKAESINLLHAKNPIEAIEIIKNQKIHAIISEINLSKLDGFSLKQQLNKSLDYANIPFIFISHQKTHQLIDRANLLDVNFFLQKPFYPNELIGLIKRMMRQ